MGRRHRLAWLLVGPGVLAMLGENDGPSMISYTTDGAVYGLGFFLPFTVLLFAMARRVPKGLNGKGLLGDDR